MMIRLKSLLTEAAPVPKSASLTYVDNDGKYIKFNSQKEMDAFRIKIINRLKDDGFSSPNAADMFKYDYSTAREWIADDGDLSLGKIPDKYWPEATIPDAEEIERFYKVLATWKQEAEMREAKWLEQNTAYFDKGKKKNPEIFRPDTAKGTPMYRGLRSIRPDLKKLIKTSDWKDWERTEFKAGKGERDYWYTYRGKYTYVPKKPAQSWTTNPKVVLNTFYQHEGSVILTKPLDDEFYFSKKFLDWVSNGEFKGEDEVIRIAAKGKDVELLVARRTIMSIKGHDFSDSDKLKMLKRGW